MNKKNLLALLLLVTGIASASSSVAPTSKSSDCAFRNNTLRATAILTPEEVDATFQQAFEYADYVLELLEMDMPNIEIVENSTDASVTGDTMFIGDGIASQMGPVGIAQLILHEVGHIAEGHTHNDTASNITTLVELGVLTPEQQAQITQFEELVSDVYAAFAVWILEPDAEVSELGQWLIDRNDPPSATHPDADTRVDFMDGVVQSLDQAMDSGTLQGTFLHDVAVLNVAVQALTHDHDHDGDGHDGDGHGHNHEGDDGADGADGSDGGDGAGGDGSGGGGFGGGDGGGGG